MSVFFNWPYWPEAAGWEITSASEEDACVIIIIVSLPEVSMMVIYGLAGVTLFFESVKKSAPSPPQPLLLPDHFIPSVLDSASPVQRFMSLF